MKKLFIVFTVLVLFLFPLKLQSQEKNRMAIITDKGGVTTEVKNLNTCGSYYAKFDLSGRHFVVVTDIFEVAIPSTLVHSISVNGGIANFKYQFRGSIHNISGKLKAGTLEGDSDFGEYKLANNKLQLLKFDKPPMQNGKMELGWDSSRLMKDKGSCDATLILTDGKSVTVSDLCRHDSYYSSEGYVIGGKTRYHFYVDFRFLRGESLATVKFSNLQRIDFGANKAVTVVLKNGKKASGKFSNEKGAGVEGFTGFYDKGYFFIDPSHIKSIVFK